MPIETSPIPFGNLHLPYTPLFDPVGGDVAPNGTIIGGGTGAAAPLAHGPASVAASAIIGPTPGGVAGPHHAIAALPDAGYTAPTIRAASLTGYPPNVGPQGGYHLGGGGREEYAGGSMYGSSSPQYPPSAMYEEHRGPLHHPHPHHQHHHTHTYTHTAGSTYSDGWSASLPAPRRAPIIPPLQTRDVPRGGAHDRSPSTHLSPHQSKHQHSPRHHKADFDDGASDASYYAMPRKNGHHRSSFNGSSASESPSPGLSPRHERDDLHRRTVSTNHHRRPRSSSIGEGSPLGHSPIAPSPLRVPTHPELRGRTDRDRTRRQSLDASGEDGLSLGLSHSSVDGRRRRSSYSHSHSRTRAPSAHGTEPGEPISDRRPGMGRRKSSLRPVPGSVSDSEEVRTRRSSVRQRSTSRLRRRSREDSDIHSERDQHQGREEVGDKPRRTASILKGSEVRNRHHREKKHEEEEEESPYHRPHLPIDHSPLLAPHSGTEYAPSQTGGQGCRPRRQSHQDHLHYHGHHRTSHKHPNEDDDLVHNHHHRHRRTLSEQGYGDRPYFPPPHAGTLYPGQSASVVGFEQHPHPHHHPTTTGSRRIPDQRQPFPQQIDGGQSVHPPANGVGMDRDMGLAYDDAASAAGTAMTFMDGPIGGRVSQYGLPKYAHNPKVDYRRFCVQRGNADVFLD